MKISLETVGALLADKISYYDRLKGICAGYDIKSRELAVLKYQAWKRNNDAVEKYYSERQKVNFERWEACENQLRFVKGEIAGFAQALECMGYKVISRAENYKNQYALITAFLVTENDCTVYEEIFRPLRGTEYISDSPCRSLSAMF